MHQDSEETIGFLLVETARLLRARMDRALEKAGLGLTPGEARTLLYVRRHCSVRQTALAQAMGVEPMTLVGFLDRLEARGLVTREPDPEDRRAKRVGLTPQAAEVVEGILAVAGGVRAAAMAGFSADEAELFRESLRRLRATLNEPDEGQAR